MIVITDKVTCCGCWACENICPKHCVVMKEDNEGFRYPEVDVEVCIECGLCEAVCPILHKPIKEHEETIGYVIQHKDNRNYILFTPKIRFSFEFSKSLYSNSFSKFIVISIAITV